MTQKKLYSVNEAKNLSISETQVFGKDFITQIKLIFFHLFHL